MPSVLESCVYAEDLDAAEGFYGGVVGLEKLFREGDRHVFYHAEGGMLLVFNPVVSARPLPEGALPVPAHGAHGPGHVCFAVGAEGIEGWRERLAAHGVAVESQVDWPNGAVSLYVRDPAGNSVEFAEPKLWGL